ncbi:hypothetical protein CEXT_446131 [Caerostris extrusa]|uniref:Maturase n=1 Tax=Caerostris extrusa TaxID=172846 RepID=A0AAV4X1R4_CAEEX|nr:hypothetical protein CEXT_446131 [Caerostris extrusa]
MSHSPHDSLIGIPSIYVRREYHSGLQRIGVDLKINELHRIPQLLFQCIDSLGSYRYFVSHSPHDSLIGISSILGHREYHCSLQRILADFKINELRNFTHLLLTGLRFRHSLAVFGTA